MKKKLGVIITLLTLCICLMTPQMHAKAASGKTTIAVSAGSLNIGQTVTVTAKALSASGDSAYANMVLTYDAGILEFVSCNATYGGGGGSISVASDSFSVTLKAISAGKASISLSATDGVIYGTEEELDSMAGSSTSVTVKTKQQAAIQEITAVPVTTEAPAAMEMREMEAVLEQEVTTILEAIRIRQLYPQIIP